MKERYSRNIPAVSEGDMDILQKSSVVVLGCGGLGGYVLEFLLRCGVGRITAVDGDVFSKSNLNRQILSSCLNLGKPKVFEAAKRAAEINPDVCFIPAYEYFTADNADRLLAGADLVIDALDNIPSRLIMEEAAARHRLAVVHGAIEGTNVQAMLIPPGSGLLKRLYGEGGPEPGKSALPMTPAFCAAVEVTAAVEYLCGRSTGLEGSLLVGGLRPAALDIIPLG